MKKKAIKIILTIMIIVLVSFIINTTYSKYYFSNSINGSIITVNKYVRDYSYTGNYQVFDVPYTSKYKIELWGAQGGKDPSASFGYSGSKGAYTSGIISLTKGQKLYIYVGSQGASNGFSGGWNGGGRSYSQGTTVFYGYGGGGATDVRILDGAWNDFDSLKTRIMVAAGGTGGYEASHGGGLTGIYVTGGADNGLNCGKGGTQTAGGAGGDTTSFTNQCFGGAGKGRASNGGFGYGGDGGESGSGGGGGYFGGGGGFKACNSNGGGIGGGGSSYISGHTGCVAVALTSTPTNIKPRFSWCTTGTTDNTCSINYSTVYFTDTVMIDGNGYSWTNTKGSLTRMYEPNGSSANGHSGNGHARITKM